MMAVETVEAVDEAQTADPLFGSEKVVRGGADIEQRIPIFAEEGENILRAIEGIVFPATERYLS